jgi:outer membrane protein assembly factor BamB
MKAFLVLALAVLFACSAYATDWPIYRFNLEHTSFTPDAGPTNNTVMWAYATGNTIESSPIISNGIVYVGSFNNNVYAINAATGTLNWSYGTGGNIYSAPSISEGKLYIGSTSHKLYALNATTGALNWSYDMGNIIYDASPTIADGIVYMGSNNNKLQALNATDATSIWNYTFTDAILSSPAVVGGTVYIGSRDHRIVALDAYTGALNWTYWTGGGIWSSPAVADGIVYVGCGEPGNKLYALNAATGALNWSFSAGNWVFDSPAVADGIVYAASRDSKIYALNATTGALIWNYTTGGEVWSSPAVAGGILYIGSNDNKLYALNATTGAFVWSYATGNKIQRSSPAVSDGKLYVGSYDGKIYAFGPDTTPPAVSSVSPTTATQGIPTDFRVTASDINGIANCSLYWNGSLMGSMDLLIGTNLSGTWNYSYAPPDLGSQYAWANCSDAAGNTNKANTTINVVEPDLTSPSVSSVSPATVLNNTVVQYSVTATDNVAVTSCEFYWDDIDNGAMSNMGGDTWAAGYIADSNGSHYAWANCSDFAGNTNKTNTTMTVNIIPPHTYSQDYDGSANPAAYTANFDGTQNASYDWSNAVMIHVPAFTNGWFFLNLSMPGGVNESTLAVFKYDSVANLTTQMSPGAYGDLGVYNVTDNRIYIFVIPGDPDFGGVGPLGGGGGPAAIGGTYAAPEITPLAILAIFAMAAAVMLLRKK